MHMGRVVLKACPFSKSATLDGSTHLLIFKIIQTWVEMVSEADNAFLHVHLDHVQLKSQSQDYPIVSGSAIWFCKIWTVQKPELTAKMPRKCLSQDCWLKDSAYQEWILKVDECLMCGVRNSAHFLCTLLLWWSLQNLTLVLTSPYKVVIWL